MTNAGGQRDFQFPVIEGVTDDCIKSVPFLVRNALIAGTELIHLKKFEQKGEPVVILLEKDYFVGEVKISTMYIFIGGGFDFIE